MAICILKREPGQKIARPFNRAFDVGELAWTLVYHAVSLTASDEGVSPHEARQIAKAAADLACVQPERCGRLDLSAIDTDWPVMTAGKTKFYAFNEE